MKQVIITSKNMNRFSYADVSDIDDVLGGIDRELERHGLELVVGSNGDYLLGVTVKKREK